MQTEVSSGGSLEVTLDMRFALPVGNRVLVLPAVPCLLRLLGRRLRLQRRGAFQRVIESADTGAPRWITVSRSRRLSAIVEP